MFANPVFLYALLAGAIPVLVHLIFRRKRTAVEYPTLMFFHRVDMKLASRRKLKEILLLILRALALMLVALALARPGWQSSSTTEASADAVLIVDNSASMGLSAPAGTRLEQAKSRAKSIVNAMGRMGRLALITTVSGDPAGEVATLSSDTERLNRGVDALYPTAGASNMAGALARAKDILKQSASSLNREIFIVSDFQANGWSDANALKDSAGKGLENTQVYLCGVPGSAPEKNLALQGLSSDSRPPIAGRKMRVLVKVKNASLGDSSANLTVNMDGVPVQSTQLTISGKGSTEVPLMLPLNREGFLAGNITLGDDDAAYDNVLPFALDVRGPLKVLLLSPNPLETTTKKTAGEAFFLSRALDPTGDGRLSGIKVTKSTPQNLPADLSEFEAIVLCGGWSGISEKVSALTSYVENGGGLLLFSRPRDNDPAGNKALEKLLNVAVLGAQGAMKEAAFSVTVSSPASAFFDDLRDTGGNVDLKEITVFNALKTQPGNETEILAQLSGGIPALIARTAGKGRVMGWTFSLLPEDSNLPLMPAFLPLLHRSIAVLAGVQGNLQTQKAGLPMSWPVGDYKDGKLTVIDPAGRPFEVSAEGGRAAWPFTGRAGVYRLEWKGGTPKAVAGQKPPLGFSITPDASESETQYYSPDEARGLLPVPKITVVPIEADLAEVLRATRQGRDLFTQLLFLALLVILAEVLLANQVATRIKTPIKPLKKTDTPIPPLKVAEPDRETVNAGSEDAR